MRHPFVMNLLIISTKAQIKGSKLHICGAREVIILYNIVLYITQGVCLRYMHHMQYFQYRIPVIYPSAKLYIGYRIPDNIS